MYRVVQTVFRYLDRFDVDHECDRRTDGIVIAIAFVGRVTTRVKNYIISLRYADGEQCPCLYLQSYFTVDVVGLTWLLGEDAIAMQLLRQSDVIRTHLFPAHSGD